MITGLPEISLPDYVLVAGFVTGGVVAAGFFATGFLAAGLFCGLSLGGAGFSVKVFFLVCVLIAGLYGAATASKKILYVQALPAAVGLVLLWLS